MSVVRQVLPVPAVVPSLNLGAGLKPALAGRSWGAPALSPLASPLAGIAPAAPMSAAASLPAEPAAPALPGAAMPAAPAPGGEGGHPEAGSAESAHLFDGTARLSPLPVDAAGDLVPEWPGQEGDTVRINGNAYVLGEKLGEGTGAFVYRVQGRPLVVKLIYPGLADIPVFGSEVPALKEMAAVGIEHARMRDHSADGMVIVKDLVDGERIYDVAERGGLDRERVASLVGLAASLIAMERTADLNLGNLIWDAGKKTWVLIDAGGFAKGPAWGVLGQILSPGRTKLTRIVPADFLDALAARLGRDSDAWRRVMTPPDHLKDFVREHARTSP